MALSFSEVRKAAQAAKSKSGDQSFDDLEDGFDAEDDVTGDEQDNEPDEDDNNTPDGQKQPTMNKRFAYDPGDGSEPKLPIGDAKHVAMAAEALGPSGFRGHKVQIPKDKLAEVKARVRAAWKEHNPGKDESEMPDSIKKGYEDIDLGLAFKVTKYNDEQQVVYGFASVSALNGAEISDLQNDVIDMSEVTKAAHDFMLNSRLGGEMHGRTDAGMIVESLVIDKAVKDALGIDRAEEGWFIGFKVADEATWQKVKNGEFGGFSIGGTGVRTPE